MKLRSAIGLLLGLAVLGIVQITFVASDKYRLSWISDPATTMTIGWSRTSGDAFGVKYGTDPELTTYTTQVVDITRTYDNTASAEGGPLVSYFCDLTGLQTDTVYYFRTYYSRGDNTIYWFKTAPDTPKPVNFLSGGDSRTQQEPRQWGNTLVSKLRSLFVAFGGDYHDDWQYTISSDSFWQFKLIQADPSNIYIRTVKFGQYDAGGNPVLGYEMDDVAALTQDASVCPAWDIDSDGTITIRDAQGRGGVYPKPLCPSLKHTSLPGNGFPGRGFYLSKIKKGTKRCLT